jgi:hypothetical protein
VVATPVAQTASGIAVSELRDIVRACEADEIVLDVGVAEELR